MPWSEAEIRANRDYFERKIRAIKQRNDVLTAIERGPFDFVLLDTRPRDAFKFGHITGAWCAPFDELDKLVAQLPKDREIVHTVGATIDTFQPKRLCSWQSEDSSRKS